MPSIDTNIILRIILNDVEEQRDEALKLLTKHDKVALADLAVSEAVYVLERALGVSRPAIVELVISLINNQHITMNKTLFRQVLPLYSQHLALSFNDCCLATYAELNNQIPLFTFDKALAKNLDSVQLV